MCNMQYNRHYSTPTIKLQLIFKSVGNDNRLQM